MAHSVHRRRGFTMVEILVVVGVIILLAGLIFPVISRVRESGRSSACNNNLHQLGMAFQQYRNDWGERFPNAGSFRLWDRGAHWVSGVAGNYIGSLDGSPGLEPTGCQAGVDCNTANPEGGAIYSYVKSPEPYICPSNAEGKAKRLSYSMNCAIARMAENRIKAPSEIVLLVDEDTANDGYFFAQNTDSSTNGGLTFITQADPNNPVTPTSTDTLTQKHNGGGNLLFVDGHAHAYPFAAFPLDASPIGLQNKGRMDGVPRFHDKAFGPHGSYMPAPPPGVSQVDACGVLP